MVTIKINCDNAAFDDDPGAELARILRELANRLHISGAVQGSRKTLYDLNGNDVGCMNIDLENACPNCGSLSA